MQVRVPESLIGGGSGKPLVEHLDALDTAALFSDDRRSTHLATAYHDAIASALDSHAASGHGRLAACLIEPVMQGAGGMNFIDPLFQKLLVAACRSRGIPVIADEVFSGLWRLGHPSACGALGVAPDIACYAKLLTAGVVPLSVTLASDAVFAAFEGDSKAEALLHGHSYTAHPAGCQVLRPPSVDPASSSAVRVCACAPAGSRAVDCDAAPPGEALTQVVHTHAAL